MDKVFANVQNNLTIYGKEPIIKVRAITTIRDMFDSSTEIFKDNTAYLVKDAHNLPYRKIKYSELREDVYRLATAFYGLGLNGKKIAVMGENRYEWAITYLSVVCGTGTVVPIDKELPENEIQNLLDIAEVSALVYSSKVYKKHKEYIDGLTIKTICMDSVEDNENIPELLKAGTLLREQGHREFDDAVVKPDDVNIILFTSGTTGSAKGVMLSHKNIATNLMNMCALVDIPETFVFFSLLPIHHTYECTCGFLCPIYRGSCIAFCEGLKYIVKNMQEAHPTIFLAVPLIIDSMYNQIQRKIIQSGKEKKLNFAIKLSNALLKIGIDLRKTLFKEIHENLGGNLKIFISGGAPGNDTALKWFRSIGIYAIQGYGLTECAPIAALNRLSLFDDMAAGLPLIETAIKIDNPDKDGVGEVLIKGDNVMVGYYKNDEATANAIQNGWYHSGDLGYIKNNFVYITGRAKDVIITANGKNVFPEEVENYLSESKLIKECMVYGKKDQRGNESIVAVLIYPDKETAKVVLGESFTDEALRNAISTDIKEINQKMPPYKAVMDFTLLDHELVKTTTNKIKRFANKPE